MEFQYSRCDSIQEKKHVVYRERKVKKEKDVGERESDRIWKNYFMKSVTLLP